MKVTLWEENASAVNWHDMPLTRRGSKMMEVPGTILLPETVRLNQHLWAHRTPSELWVPSFPKCRFIFVPFLESCQPTDTCFFGKNAVSAWTRKGLHGIMLRALTNTDVTQCTRSNPSRSFHCISPCRRLVFPALPILSLSFHSLSRSPTQVTEGLWSPTLPWLVSNYSQGDLVIQINAIIWSVGSGTLTLLCWVATVVQALSAFPSSFLTYWSCTRVLSNWWHRQNSDTFRLKGTEYILLSPKQMLQLNSIFEQEYL